jgi:hypothetical protein
MVKELFIKRSVDGKLSTKQLKKVFEEEPFCMDNEEMSLLFARYLIEDNKDELVIFDEN